jgi:hypothetical protein
MQASPFFARKVGLGYTKGWRPFLLRLIHCISSYIVGAVGSVPVGKCFPVVDLCDKLLIRHRAQAVCVSIIKKRSSQEESSVYSVGNQDKSVALKG